MAFSPTDVCDYIIVGSGIAGLRAAIALAPIGRVLILTKADPSESNTGYAQGGIAAALGPGDSPDRHAQDTLKAGDGLCDERAVRVLVEEGPRYVRELISWGANFDRDEHGELAFGLEAAHGVRRILHAGDATGRSIGRAMWAQVRPLGTVSTINHAFVTDLNVKDGRVAGVWFFDQTGARRLAAASAVLLATGGAGQVFSETTNPAVATGDGIALAFNAGARVADLEFVQFHPTALKKADAPRFLISEALRGEGARLINVHGDTFMTKYHPDGDLAPRDVVARGIVRESEATGRAGVSHAGAPECRTRPPTVSDDRRDVPAGRNRHRGGPHSGRSRCALSHGRRGDRRVGPHVAARTVRCRRDGVHRRPWRESSGQQFAAGRARIRRSRSRSDAAAGRRRPLARG